MQSKTFDFFRAAGFFAACSILAVFAFAGCEQSDEHAAPYFSAKGEAGGVKVEYNASSEIVGSWSLTDADGFTWYIHFGGDKSWKITDGSSPSSRLRVYGTYGYSNGKFSGNMKNDNVGEGEIAGTIAGNMISLGFVEFWHTPHKKIEYTGSRLP